MILDNLRTLARKNHFLRQLIAYYIAPSGIFDKVILNKTLSSVWQKRLEDTLKCDDNVYIKRVKNAGSVIRGKQIMHNGIKIHLGSYYGPEVAIILKENKGVHEPQEERVFHKKY